MDLDNVLQLIGIVAIVGMSALSVRVLIDEWWGYYGKQALVAWIVLGLVIGTVRFADLIDVITPETSRGIAGVAYIVCLVAMTEVIAMHELGRGKQ